MQKIGVMFVCLGNICRSPMAEAIFKDLLVGAGLEGLFEVQSCGTAGYHINENADKRTLQVLSNHHIKFSHSAQQLHKSHSSMFQYFAVMDDSNLKNSRTTLGPDTDAMVFKIRDFDNVKKGCDLNDPYYGELDGFELCYEQLTRSCDNFLQFLIEKHDLTKR